MGLPEETRAAIRRLKKDGENYRNPVWLVQWTEKDGSRKLSLYTTPRAALQGGAAIVIEAMKEQIADPTIWWRMVEAYRANNWQRVLVLFGEGEPSNLNSFGLGCH